MSSNVKSFPVNTETKIDNIMKDFREILDREFGPNNFASYVTIVSAPTLGKTEDVDTEITSYRFTTVPTDADEDHVDTFVGLLYQSMGKDPNIGRAVINKYADKLAELLGHIIESESEDEEEE